MMYQFKFPRLKILCVLHLHSIMWHSHLNDMGIPETRRFIPKGFELGTTLNERFALLTVHNLTFCFHKSEIIFSSNKTDIAIL